MLLVSIFVLTNTVSTDGSVGGIYHASLQLAQQTADNATRSPALPEGMKKLEGSVNDLMGTDENADKPSNPNNNQNSANQNYAPQNQQSKPKNGESRQKNR